MSPLRQDLFVIALLASGATAYAWWLAGHPPAPAAELADQVLVERGEAAFEPARPRVADVGVTTSRRRP